jgi:2'-5' RNA ligase
MSTKRLFFGVRLPRDMHERLTEIQRRSRKEDDEDALRWVHPDNFHVTLHFLGDTTEELVPELIAQLGEAVARIPEAECSLHRAGTFPSTRRPRVLWVGINDDNGVLARVYDALTPALEDLEFAIDTRPYHPHITLGYARKKAHPKAVARAFAGFVAAAQEVLTEGKPQILRVSEVELIQSDLGSRGPTYTTVATGRLAPS